MTTVFLVCAALGGVVMLCQFALMLAGFGGDHDAAMDHHVAIGDHSADGSHADHGATWFLHVLSFRSVVAALTFFGLGGLAASSSQMPSWFAFPIAVASGSLAMFIVAWLMGLLYHLQAEGTVRIERAVGATATVYLSIPPHGGGSGKVTVKLQNRTMEYLAISHEETPIETGTPVVVVGIVGPNTVEVGPVPE